jgi:hypothetical protein
VATAMQLLQAFSTILSFRPPLTDSLSSHSGSRWADELWLELAGLRSGAAATYVHKNLKGPSPLICRSSRRNLSW